MTTKSLSRRDFLRSSAAITGAAAASAALPAWMPRLAFAPQGQAARVEQEMQAFMAANQGRQRDGKP